MNVRIRAMERRDIPEIAAWMVDDPHWQAYGMTVDSITADFSSAFARQHLLSTAELDGRPVGFAWCIPDGMFGSSPYLKRIGVDPGVTGQSIGASLMDALEQELAAAGSRHLYLLVGSRNRRAEAFYQRRKYVQLANFPDFAVSGVDERLYRKELTPLSY